MDVYRVLNAVLKEKLVTLHGAKGSGKVCWLLGYAISCIIGCMHLCVDIRSSSGVSLPVGKAHFYWRQTLPILVRACDSSHKRSLVQNVVRAFTFGSYRLSDIDLQ